MSELENLCIFAVLLTNCNFSHYFVGSFIFCRCNTKWLSVYMYRQNFECTDKPPKRHYWGGAIAPFLLPGYTNDVLHGCMWYASERSERAGKFWNFYMLKTHFHSIFPSLVPFLSGARGKSVIYRPTPKTPLGLTANKMSSQF